MERKVCGDLEANGLLKEATKVWCGVFKDINTGEKFVFRPNQIQDMLSFLDTVDVLIGHNIIGYDLPLLRKLHSYKFKGKIVDTLIMSRVLKDNRPLPHNCPRGERIGPHSVEAWGYRLGREKPEHEEWGFFSEEMLHRCSEDVEIQIGILNALSEEMRGFKWGPAFRLTFKVFEILQRQEEYGWLVDRAHVEKSIHMLTHFIERIDKALITRLPYRLRIDEAKAKGVLKYVAAPFSISGALQGRVYSWCADNGVSPSSIAGPFSRISFERVSLDSNKETKEFLLQLGWEPEFWNTNDAGEKTSPKLSGDDPFHGIQGSLGRLIAKRVQCRHRRSQLEGWLNNIEEDGRIRGRVTGLATTGRAKHSKVVNVPGADAFFGKYMRKTFICKEGFRIVGTDSAGCQNRMLAARVGDPVFTNILINGKKEDGTSIHHINKKAIKDVAGRDVSYGLAKGLNYAFMFGASDNKLGKMVNGTAADGAQIRKALLSVSAGFQTLVEELTAEWRRNAKRRKNKWGKIEYHNGWVTGLDGRPIFIESEHTILVYVLQSDEAIMMQGAYVLLYDRAEKRGWKHGEDWGYLIWYHDEFQAEVREDIAEEFAKLAEQCIADAGKIFNIACPHEGDSGIGKNWYETH